MCSSGVHKILKCSQYTWNGCSSMIHSSRLATAHIPKIVFRKCIACTKEARAPQPACYPGCDGELDLQMNLCSRENVEKEMEEDLEQVKSPEAEESEGNEL